MKGYVSVPVTYLLDLKISLIFYVDHITDLDTGMRFYQGFFDVI